MKRMLIATAAVAVAVLASASVGAQDGKAPSVKDVMKKLNFKDAALCPTLGKALKAETPNWDDVQRDTKVLVEQVEVLTKSDPPRGDKASWTKLTAAYVADAKALDGAAQQKDRTAAQAAHAKIANPAYCTRCHQEHRN